MLSSISSKCAFSQGGITISKLCNCLRGDIVKALQCIKCGIQHDLVFRELGLSSRSKDDNEDLEDISGGDSGNPDESDVEEFSWDDLLIEDEDDQLMMDWSESE